MASLSESSEWARLSLYFLSSRDSKQDLQLSPYYRPLVLSQRMKLFSFNAFQPLSQTGEHPSLLGQANIMIGPMLLIWVNLFKLGLMPARYSIKIY